MKTAFIVAISVITGFSIGIASFKDGYDKQAYSLQWGWGIGEYISSDCLFLNKRTSDHSTKMNPLFCVKNSFNK